MTQTPVYDFFCIAPFGKGGIPSFARALSKLHGMLTSIGEASSSDVRASPMLMAHPFTSVDSHLAKELSVHLSADFHEVLHVDQIKNNHSVSHISCKFKEFLRPLRVDSVSEIQLEVFRELSAILDIYIQLIDKCLGIISSAAQNKGIVVNPRELDDVLKIKRKAESILEVVNEQLLAFKDSVVVEH